MALAQGFGATPAPQAGVIYAAPPVVSPGALLEQAPAKAAPKAKPKPKAAAPVAHERVVARNDHRPSVHPESAALMQEAITRYRGLVAQGGWPILPAGLSLTIGAQGDAVLALRQRLALEGDLAREETENPVFDALLARAVKGFQSRHGQSQTGIVSGATLKALRVPASDRLRALEESARRLSARSFAFGPRYVAVNIPSASVEAIAEGQVERRFVAVVGKRERPSPEVATRITNVNFNPTWTVPVSIIKKDIIPKMQKDPGYLAKAKIRIIGASGNEVDPRLIDWHTERATAFTLRQDSGTGNSLGQIRIDMPNRDSVYMHDTPSKKLFARDDRFHSSGCVRVENVKEFSGWLLNATPRPAGGWDKAAIDAAIAANARKDVRLPTPVPVVWTYLTGYVTPDGQVHFREDVYGLDDGSGKSAPETPDVIAAPAPRPKAPAQAASKEDVQPKEAAPKAKATPRLVNTAATGRAAPVQQIDP